MATYGIDTAHSEIGFTVRHMMFSKVRGQFKTWTSKITYDSQNPEKSSLRVDVDTASIDTREEKRDGHLRSADFFDVEKFPKMTFVSKRVDKVGDAAFELVGDLTIRDVSREVTLAVEQTGAGTDPWGNRRFGYSAKTSIQRSDWGLKWNQALEAGGVLVSEKVDVHVEVELVEQK